MKGVWSLFIALSVALQFTGSVLHASETRPVQEAKDGMVYIPAGKFIRGIDDGDPLGFVWATPKSEVHVPAFYIDKYEVTNKEYKTFVDATGHRAPDLIPNPGEEQYSNIYRWENGIYTKNLDDHPVALVDWNDATAYCRWKGKRLPTEAEWEKAARGTDGRLWPWGNEFNRFYANTKDFSVQLTMPVGSFPEGASPYGVMDMAGNLFEWASDWYKGYPGTKRQHPDYGEMYKVVRGGAWASFAEPYAYTMARTAQPVDYRHRSIGFRCARSAEDRK